MNLQFLAGGGEMGERMRALDWSATSLGDPRDWPQSLRTTVGILLNSRYPMFLAWGPDLAFLYNDGYRPVFGDKHPAALGQPFAQIWSEIWGDLRPLVDRALAGEPTWSEDLQLFMERRGFPEEVYFTFSYSPVRGDDGAVAGMFCACTETTAEVVGERRLKSLRDLAAATGDARTVADACRLSAEVVASNAADIPFALIYLLEDGGKRARLAASTGCAAGATLAPLVVDVHPERAAGWPFEPMLGGGKQVLRAIDAAVALPGTPWPEPSTAAAILPLARSGQSELSGYLIAGTSPRRVFDEKYEQYFDLLAGGVANAIANAQAYESERRRAESLAEIDRAKTTFFSNVSHEFRTPLTLMLGPLDDLLSAEDGLSTPAREQLTVVRRNSLRLLKLVNSLLDFSRIEAGRVQAAFEPTDLATLTADLASNFRSACQSASLELRVDCPPLPEPVYVDREMWEKIVLNLVSNSFKFTSRGGIHVSLRATRESAVLQVRDTGRGIPSDELPRLFERFHRVEGRRGRTHEGTGIGLALVQELVKLHGGSIDVESEPGRGTTLTVAVPRGSAHLPEGLIGAQRGAASTAVRADVFVEEALRWLPEEGEAGEAGTAAAEDVADRPHDAGVPLGQRARVLVADDNADLRRYVARLLRQHWDVETAADGAEALEAARACPPDLIVTDVMMPNMDGFELVEALRADPATAQIPVIIVSARAGEEARIEGVEAGVADYLVKPFGARELVARVSSQLALAQSARERAELFERERTARQEAELQKQHLYTLFMQAPAPVVMLRGREHVIELANHPACRIWRREHEDVIGKPLLDALPELRGQVFKRLLDQVLETGASHVGAEERAKLDWSGDGSLDDVYFNFVYTPLRDIRGETDGVLVLAFDVTEQVVARERTDELRRKAEAANRAKDEFLAMLGHELRNPLAPILTALELMRLRGGDMFQSERALIERQSKQLIGLVDDLLDVSRITRGKVELRKEPVELAEVVTGAIETVSPLLEQRRHHLSVEVPKGLTVSADAARLAQVVANLLSNAAKYTEAAGRITISGERSGEEVVLTVADNGRGIPEALLPNVFDIFAQEQQAMDRSQGGLGLGLTIVRSLVSLHGGTVEARSEGVGRGSEFVVRLPAVAPVSDADAAVGPASEEGAPAYTAKRRQRILIVDDNRDAAGALAEYVEEIGHTAQVAHDGPAALRTVDAFAPHAALLDIGLPGMDGYELARRMRERDGLERLRLIAVTGYGQASEHERTRAAGFIGHLVKPIDLERLAVLLDEVGVDSAGLG